MLKRLVRLRLPATTCLRPEHQTKIQRRDDWRMAENHSPVPRRMCADDTASHSPLFRWLVLTPLFPHCCTNARCIRCVSKYRAAVGPRWFEVDASQH